MSSTVYYVIIDVIISQLQKKQSFIYFIGDILNNNEVFFNLKKKLNIFSNIVDNITIP